MHWSCFFNLARGDILERLPHGAARLEPAARGDLPNPVTALDASAVLRVAQLVPDRRARGIAIAAQRVSAGGEVVVGELERGLHDVDDRASPGVYAKMLKSAVEVGDVGGEALAQNFLAEDVHEEFEVLGERKYERRQGGDIFLQAALSATP